MYLPAIYEETRVERLHAVIRDFPLGTLVVSTPAGLEASHVPFEIDPHPAPFGTLQGHVARANPIWRDASPEVDALVIFTGPDLYISPSWYPTKRESGRVVPTWNYIAVHAYGRLQVIDDPAQLRSHLEQLVTRHEKDRPGPWAVSDAPDAFIRAQMEHVVAFEIAVRQLLGKWKLSQNRPMQDRLGVIEALEQEARPAALAMARAMRETVNKDRT